MKIDLRDIDACNNPIKGFCENPTEAVFKMYGKGHIHKIKENFALIIKCTLVTARALKEDMDIHRATSGLGRYPVRERNFDVPPCNQGEL